MRQAVETPLQGASQEPPAPKPIARRPGSLGVRALDERFTIFRRADDVPARLDRRLYLVLVFVVHALTGCLIVW